MSSADIQDFIFKFNQEYENKHREYENHFWATKMNLQGNSPQLLAKTKGELDQFLGNEEALNKVNAFLKQDLSAEDRKVLECFKRVFETYIVQDPKAFATKTRIDELEAELATARNTMNLGYTADGQFTKKSSVQLRNIISTNPDEKTRKAAYEGMRSIGPFVAEKFCEIVKLRNRFAKALGYECFYDMKVQKAEGFDKKTLFKIMDDLEVKSRPILEKARRTLAESKGKEALEPYNMSFNLSGDTLKETDPYFPFENAVDCWARSFAALGITYRQALMQLDLCDRQGKYSNGFCHWPQPAWTSPKGWVPSQANFTSLATPSAVGSGYTALVTLMHEGGHAAHFANVEQPSPLYSQERAPTSVAYAENQSMFLDSLVSDAAWLGRYALDRDGNVIPWALIEQKIRKEHPYHVFMLRGMLAVPYFEKALYELPEDQVTPENLIKLADEIEVKIQGGFSARPLLSVPHILADESAAYYHGYVLAEMSVHQTRQHFLDTYGYIVDNPKVGKDLKDFYWVSGNSRNFLDLVKGLTKKPLTADAWIHELQQPVDQLVESEKKEYAKAIEKGPTYKVGDSVDLDMQVRFVHGDLVVADTLKDNGLLQACQIYKKWVSELKE
ncbi:hypothetical protein EDD86DRAFT_197305 [Gorgonomyces haynaldii]|nr:hypothetical protein EDD86DRAFT_197305 [Gorgonomyces haynaldii]